MKFQLFEHPYAICQPTTLEDGWQKRLEGSFYALTMAADEISLVCEAARAPACEHMSLGWRALKIDERLDFAMVGIIASLSFILAENGISIFVLSTYNTDYILVQEHELSKAIGALEKQGHSVSR